MTTYFVQNILIDKELINKLIYSKNVNESMIVKIFNDFNFLTHIITFQFSFFKFLFVSNIY